MTLTVAQHEQLTKPINKTRVFSANGNAHVAGWDVIAHLNRVFGFGGWTKEVLSNELVYEAEVPASNGNGRAKWTACYRSTVRLTVFGIGPGGQDVIREDSATGVGENQPKRFDAHDKAHKEAVTYALKRAAKDFGDQFGLSLYNKGSLAATTTRTLVVPEADGPAAGSEDVEADVPAPLSMGNDERHDYADEEDQEAVERAPAKKATAKRAAKRPASDVPPGQGTASRPEQEPAVELATKDHLNTLKALGEQLAEGQRARVREFCKEHGIVLEVGKFTLSEFDRVAEYAEQLADAGSTGAAA
jgi:hypothetical protein